MAWEALEMVLNDVRHERKRQEVLKAEGRFKHTLADDGLSDGQKLCAIAEEVGEVGRDVLAAAGEVTDGDGSTAALRKELIQVAALAVAWAERLTDVSNHGTPIRTRDTWEPLSKVKY